MNTDPEIPGALSEAIEATYQTFARYGRPRESSYSTQTNITAEDVARLRATPLRALQPNDLVKFSLKALNTWGDEDEFRHYLPRMLELTVRVPHWTPLASLLGKLDTGHWTKWPEEEQRAITQFVHELWNWVIHDANARVSAVDLLLGASYAGMSFDPLVERWAGTSGATAARQLAALINQEHEALIASGLLGRRWSQEARRVLSRLLTSPATRQRLETEFFEASNREAADSISGAISVLDHVPVG